MAPIKLSNKTLTAISGALGAKVHVPQYDRTSLRAGILHFGVGNFHRSHQAVYLDDLFNLDPNGHNWAIVGAGMLPSDAKMRECLVQQDWLCTVVEQDAAGERAQITGSMIDFLPVGDSDAIIARLADPAIRIVSLTITEGGYFLHSDTGAFDASHPAIVADSKMPDHPRTVFGLIVVGLQRRHAASTPPFTVMSCDNIPHNGTVTRNAVVGTARAFALTDLAAWIEANVAFPSSMVDRITPATGERERAACTSVYGIEDGWPVFCERFKQWVLEDNFRAGRPALEKVGVQFVADVAPYEAMKLRVLNGGHAAIAYAGALIGCEFAHEAMRNHLIGSFIEALHAREILPTVPAVPGIDLQDYARVVRQRFDNPKVGDTIRRLCWDGSNRQPKFVLPTIADRLQAEQSIAGLALLSALWCRYCYGTDEAGNPIEPNDPSWDQLNATARLAKTQPHAWLDGNARVYGAVGRAERFRDVFAEALERVWRHGTARALQHYLEDE